MDRGRDGRGDGVQRSRVGWDWRIDHAAGAMFVAEDESVAEVGLEVEETRRRWVGDDDAMVVRMWPMARARVRARAVRRTTADD